MNENNFYVYAHKDPISQEIQYVGIGQYDRAWNARKNHRKPRHIKWIFEQYDKGFTLADIVEIKSNQLTKEQAISQESILINELRPVLNELKNPDHWNRGRSYTRDLAEFAKKLHEMGYGYVRIAFLMGSNSHMLAKRMVKNG